MTIVRTSALAAWMAIGSAAAAAAPTSTTPRYVCTLADGSTTVVAQDLAAQFGNAAAECVQFDVGRAAPQDFPPLPPPRRPAGRQLWSPYGALIHESAQRHRVDPRLLMAIIQVESRHRPDARSRKGALGLMQVMPATGARYGVHQSRQLFDPAVNIDVGTRYVSDLIDSFGSLELVLAAYNAGEGAVARYGNRVPPFPETRSYVRQVMALLQKGR